MNLSVEVRLCAYTMTSSGGESIQILLLNSADTKLYKYCDMTALLK